MEANVNKIPSLIIILLLTTNIASAGLFDDLLSSLKNKPAISTPESDFKALYSEVLSINTNTNIGLINDYMRAYSVNIVKIHVTDYNKNFYVIRSAGTTLETPTNFDKEISLSSSQVRQIIGFLSDENISWWEQFHMWSMRII